MGGWRGGGHPQQSAPGLHRGSSGEGRVPSIGRSVFWSGSTERKPGEGAPRPPGSSKVSQERPGLSPPARSRLRGGSEGCPRPPRRRADPSRHPWGGNSASGYPIPAQAPAGGAERSARCHGPRWPPPQQGRGEKLAGHRTQLTAPSQLLWEPGPPQTAQPQGAGSPWEGGGQLPPAPCWAPAPASPWEAARTPAEGRPGSQHSRGVNPPAPPAGRRVGREQPSLGHGEAVKEPPSPPARPLGQALVGERREGLGGYPLLPRPAQRSRGGAGRGAATTSFVRGAGAAPGHPATAEGRAGREGRPGRRGLVPAWLCPRGCSSSGWMLRERNGRVEERGQGPARQRGGRERGDGCAAPRLRRDAGPGRAHTGRARGERCGKVSQSVSQTHRGPAEREQGGALSGGKCSGARGWSHGATRGFPAWPGQEPQEGERWPRRRVGVRVGVNLAPAGLGKRAGAGEEPCQRRRRHRTEQGGTKAGSGRVAGRQRWACWMRLSRHQRHGRAQQHQGVREAPGPGAFVRRWAPSSDCRAAPSVRHRRPSMLCPSGGKVLAEVSEGQPRLSAFGIQHSQPR